MKQTPTGWVVERNEPDFARTSPFEVVAFLNDTISCSPSGSPTEVSVSESISGKAGEFGHLSKKSQ